MLYQPTSLTGAYLLDLQKVEDERGFFARSWCVQEFAEHGLDTRLVQCNISFNKRQGTVRGMHYQLPPFAETKLVRCSRGAIYDVIIDLRPTSPTFLQWFGVTLSAENRTMLYVPQGFAHGFCIGRLCRGPVLAGLSTQILKDQRGTGFGYQRLERIGFAIGGF